MALAEALATRGGMLGLLLKHRRNGAPASSVRVRSKRKIDCLDYLIY